MLKIRLARVGKKNYATFRIIVSDHTKSPKAEAIEILGSYDPNTKPATLRMNDERIKYWLSQGVGYSDTIGDLLAKKGWIKKERVKYTSTNPKKSKAKSAKDETTVTAKAPKVEAKPAENSPVPQKENSPETEIRKK